MFLISLRRIKGFRVNLKLNEKGCEEEEERGMGEDEHES
jgi:hypothetical protein